MLRPCHFPVNFIDGSALVRVPLTARIEMHSTDVSSAFRSAVAASAEGYHAAQEPLNKRMLTCL